MCSHYQAVRDLELYRRRFHVYPPAEPGKSDVWPGYLAACRTQEFKKLSTFESA